MIHFYSRLIIIIFFSLGVSCVVLKAHNPKEDLLSDKMGDELLAMQLRSRNRGPYDGLHGMAEHCGETFATKLASDPMVECQYSIVTASQASWEPVRKTREKRRHLGFLKEQAMHAVQPFTSVMVRPQSSHISIFLILLITLFVLFFFF